MRFGLFVAALGLALGSGCIYYDEPDVVPPRPEPEPEPQPPPNGKYDSVFFDFEDGPVIKLGNSLLGYSRVLARLDGGLNAETGVAVSPTGEHVAYLSYDYGINRWAIQTTSLETGESSQLAHLGGGAGRAGYPRFNPAGDTIAYVDTNETSGELEIKTIAISGGEPRLLATAPNGQTDCPRPDWSPDGESLIFALGGVFEIEIETGDAAPLVSGIDACHAVWSPTGEAIAFKELDGGFRNLHVVAADSGDSILATSIGGAGPVGQARWAPDGLSLVFVQYVEDVGAALFVADVEGGEVDFLVELNAGVGSGHPQWSDDGERILYTRFNEGGELMTIAPDGTGEESVLRLNTGISGGHAQWLVKPIVAP